MPALDVVVGPAREPHILSESQGATVGGRSRLEICFVAVHLTKPGTGGVPDPDYTTLMGGF